MCASPKDRNAIESILAVDRHQDFITHRHTYPHKSISDLLSILSGDCLYSTTLAVWSLLGTKKYYANNFYAEGYHIGQVIEALDTVS